MKYSRVYLLNQLIKYGYVFSTITEYSTEELQEILESDEDYIKDNNK